ncbi:MAG: phosphate propanoyltransferase [Candidatus Komeilibacteria bacterium]
MKEVLVEVSARHIHVTAEDFKILFNKDELTKYSDLSQPGHFAAVEQVKLIGEKGEIDNVRILGPFRSKTQVELSKTDCYALGVEAPLRLSGDLENSGHIKVVGPAGEIQLNSGVIVALRHLHISTTKAEEWGLKDGQIISVRVADGDKGDIKDMTFDEIVVRTGKDFKASVHIDTDEANAANINKSTTGIIVE